jgi:NAD(P)-dependent dehydrogenase (short-subunit alcohol dehydrogenase family)
VPDCLSILRFAPAIEIIGRTSGKIFNSVIQCSPKATSIWSVTPGMSLRLSSTPSSFRFTSNVVSVRPGKRSDIMGQFTNGWLTNIAAIVGTAGPRMRDKGFGRIIFVSSESGVQIPTEMIHYGFTKSADLALMRGFAQALAATGVTVNAVLPGPTRTEGVDDMFRSMGQSAADPKAQREFIDKARPSSIIKRLEQPEEIAEVVAFLVSREAAAISGSPVRADGGVVLAIT